MEYKLEEVSPVKREIKVTVPAEEVNAALGATIALYRRDVDLKGFRKGKVPSSVIENRFKKQIYSEAKTDLINLHINEILNELKIIPLSGINVDGGELEKNKEYEYTISFEVAPQFDLPNYKGLEVEEEEVEIKEEEVDEVIERLRHRMAEWIVVEEDRFPQKGDMVIIDFKASQDDKPLQGIEASNFQLILGEGQALEDFEQIIFKLKPGQTGEGEVTFPDDFINKDLAGKTVKMEVTLHSIKQKKLPELNDSFARSVGNFKNMQELRTAITKSYEATRKELVKSVAQSKLLDRLRDQVDFELPSSLVEFHLKQKIEDYVSKLEKQGKSLESTGKTLDVLRSEFKKEAEDLAKSELILLAIAQQEGLKVDPSEVEAEIQKIATYSGRSFEEIKDIYEKKNLMVALKDRILCDKAMELVYEQAKVKKVPANSLSSEEDNSKSE